MKTDDSSDRIGKGSTLTHEKAWDWLHAVALFAFAGFVSFSIAGAHISLTLLSLCWLAAIFKEPRQNSPAGPALALGLEWPIAAFTLIAVFSTLLSDNLRETSPGLRYLLTMIGAYTVAHSLHWRPDWRRPLLWTFIGAATLAALYGLGKFALGFSSKVQSAQAITMTWGALSAMFIVVTLQMAIAAPNRSERWIAGVALIPQIFALLLSFVRGAYVGFAAGAIYLVYLYWLKHRQRAGRILAVILICSAIIAAFSVEAARQRITAIFDLNVGSTQVRLIQWKYALRIIMDHPILGVGWRDMAEIFRRYVPPDLNLPEDVKSDIFIGHFHNSYLMVAACYGVTGLIAYLWLLAAVWRQLGAIAKAAGAEEAHIVIDAIRAAMIGFLVASCFDTTFGDHEVVTMFWFLIGMGLGQGSSISRLNRLETAHIKTSF
jgi:O-antigen ligase